MSHFESTRHFQFASLLGSKEKEPKKEKEEKKILLCEKSFTCRRDSFQPLCLPRCLPALVSSLPVPLTTAHPYSIGARLKRRAIMKYYCRVLRGGIKKAQRDKPCHAFHRSDAGTPWRLSSYFWRGAVAAAAWTAAHLVVTDWGCNMLKQAAHGSSDTVCGLCAHPVDL